MKFKIKNFSDVKNYYLIFVCLFPIFYILGSMLVNISIILVFLIYLVFNSNHQTVKFIKNNLIYILIIFLFLIINISVSEIKQFTAFKGFSYIRFFTFVIGLIFILNLLDYKVKLYSKFLIYLSLFLVFDIFFQYYSGKDVFGYAYFEQYGRTTGPFGGGEYIVGGFLLNLGFLGIALINLFYKIKNTHNFLLFLSISIAILFTGERSAFLSLIYLYFFIFLLSNKRTFILFSLIALLGLSFVSIKYSNNLSKKYSVSSITAKINVGNSTTKFETTENLNDITSSEIENNNKLFRTIEKIAKNNKWFAHYGRAFEVFLDHKIFGGGFKNYRYICRNYESEINKLKCSTHPHNFHFEILADTGLLGYLIFITFFIYLSTFFFKIKLRNNFGVTILYCLIITYIFPFKPTGSIFSTNSAYILWFLVSHYFYVIYLFKNKSNLIKN